MPEYLAPGIYVEEMSFRARPIQGVPTSVAAFVGRCQRGPVDTPVSVQSFQDFETRFGSHWQRSELPSAVSDFFENGGREALVVRIANSATAARFRIPSSHDKENPLLLEAANPGSWGKRLAISLVHHPSNRDLFSLEILDLGSKRREAFGTLSCRPRSKFFIAKILKRSSELLRVVHEKRRWQVPHSRPHPARSLICLSGTGTDGKALIADDFSNPVRKRRRTGLYALKRADSFNLLYLPPYRANGSVDRTLIREAATFCEGNRAFLILDPPPSWDSVQAAANPPQPLPTSSRNAAVFFPRIRKRDPLDPQKTKVVAPGGSIAGIFARVDATRGVWKAPAGVAVKGADGLQLNLSSAEQSILNPQAINCLRAFPNRGILLWGARTLQGKDSLSSEWKYIAVRRLALYIESSLDRGTRWAVFEPNNANLWKSLAASVTNFLHELWRRGAFQGASAEDAFFVRCDRSTMTQADIDAGRLVCQIGFAPLKPAEFVVLRLSQRTAS